MNVPNLIGTNEDRLAALQNYSSTLKYVELCRTRYAQAILNYKAESVKDESFDDPIRRLELLESALDRLDICSTRLRSFAFVC